MQTDPIEEGGNELFPFPAGDGVVNLQRLATMSPANMRGLSQRERQGQLWRDQKEGGGRRGRRSFRSLGLLCALAAAPAEPAQPDEGRAEKRQRCRFRHSWCKVRR